jgi:hypothetical protein
MAFAFNPFTGNFDLKGSGGGASYIDGEVQNFSALPETLGTPAVDSAYLVREAEGTWLLARKPAGIYIRTDDTGVRADDWTHAGAFPDVFNDANFLLYDNADSSKNLAFQLSGITTGTTRTITVPDANVTLPNQGTSTGDSPTFAALAVSAVGGDGVQLVGCDDDGNIRSTTTFNSGELGAARTALGLGTAATADIGTGSTNVLAPTIVDAKGDLIVASAADTVARLAVGGTNGHVLTVDSAETLGLKYAALPAELVIACSDETTNLTTGTAKVTFRMPYAMTLSSVRASVNTAPTGSTLIVDINEGGSTILSTKLSIDASELTSTTAATAAVISDTALADDAEVTIDIDQIGSTIAGKGLKVVLKGVRA